ncbi:preprotein translocase subunit SecE [candidate division CPR3 bacterium 4484_211]|uniref:Protein translocase subunit SecE n=1 Tax=candidate division CPR3 bacterium 4484_211 TaxID=1968527 RepID=A0A1W9NXN8_UNCC3|nr:MAG: preprotein translocase subunit SecE [candidate division CPR3 bacterium 4484_211]
MRTIWGKVVVFLKQVKAELKRVKWPTSKEVRRLTLLVVITMIILGLYIGIIDVILTKLIEWGIR